MTPSDKAYYSDGNSALFKLMSQEHDLLLTEGQMWDIIECVRKMDGAHDITRDEFLQAWLQKAHNWNAQSISAQYIVKMIQAGYDDKKIISELSVILDGIYDKWVKKIEMEAPPLIYIDPKNYTIPQLEQLIAFKKKQEGGE